MPILQRSAVSLADVLARPDIWRGDKLASATTPAMSSGFAALDAQLPGNGWPCGALTEILSDQRGIGECSLLLPALGRLREQGRWSLLVAPPLAAHGPAWASAGCDLSRQLVVAPQSARDALWATEQALASGALGGVLCWAQGINAAQIRRLEVAVAGSRTVAFLFRPARAQNEASSCALRLLLSAGAGGSLAVRLLKRRGSPYTRTLHLPVARPLPWRENNDPTLACAPFSVPAARSPRHTVAA